ncbi:unnamed protein product [Ambrosiozyma monospora]|uniref:Unnamed protein product n=1 Tax=Ambrosiozyma monospora TaxID=43982 RepID=A0A9W6YWF4_AMBMO|nr:unnamed protein product [Ambrosiozyma monospora]
MTTVLPLSAGSTRVAIMTASPITEVIFNFTISILLDLCFRITFTGLLPDSVQNWIDSKEDWIACSVTITALYINELCLHHFNMESKSCHPFNYISRIYIFVSIVGLVIHYVNAFGASRANAKMNEDRYLQLKELYESAQDEKSQLQMDHEYGDQDILLETNYNINFLNLYSVSVYCGDLSLTYKPILSKDHSSLTLEIQSISISDDHFLKLIPEADYIGTPKDGLTKALMDIFDEDDLRFTPLCLKDIKDRLHSQSQQQDQKSSSVENEKQGQQQHTPEQLV